jgi:hypothetical protein
MSGLSPRGFDLRDAGWFLHDIDAASGRAGFVRTDRAAVSAEPFLDHRWRAAGGIGAVLPLSELRAGAQTPRLSFIWHTSFCASTLLSACLDTPGRCLALKEPQALVALAALKLGGHLAHRPGLAKVVFELLARRFEPDEQILIKPSNGANALLAEAAAMTEGRQLLLYSDCESFVLSMAKQGSAGFAYVRNLFGSLAVNGHPVSRLPVPDLLRFTDLQLAALVWRMQMDGLEAASARLGDRARSLDCRVFLDDPERVLGLADHFLGLGIGPEQIEEVAAGPLFRRDAKRPGQAYSARSRADKLTQLRAHLGGDLAAAVRMVEDMYPRPPRLAKPLVAQHHAQPHGERVAMPAA